VEGGVAFRSLTVVAIHEVLRRWKAGESLRTVSAAVGVDRKTARRYVAAAEAQGLRRGGGPAIDDELIGAVVLAVMPGGASEVGAMRALCRAHEARIVAWVEEGCRGPRVAQLLQQQTGVRVPLRTLNRFIAEELPGRKPSGTVRVVDPPAGQVLEMDFMDFGLVPLGGEPTRLYALVCVAARSRHAFFWPCLGMTLEDVIAGLDAAWAFFGGVFPVVVTDNPKPIVLRADPHEPVLNEDFAEYAQARGFIVDLARVRRPQDKPRVERTVGYIRGSALVGERLVDLGAARRQARCWCLEVAGQRLHGTTGRRPIEAFEEERPLLLPAPEGPYDRPAWSSHMVGRDGVLGVEGALYSVPHALQGHTLRVRTDRNTVKVYDGGVVVKVHARALRGETVLDPADLPADASKLATRNTTDLVAEAVRQGEAVGRYAARLLEGHAFWTRARQVYLLLGLCRAHGAEAVDTACRQALELDVVEVPRVKRMLEMRLPAHTPSPPSATSGTKTRFGRDPQEFRSSTPKEP
jgi:transposase